MLRISLKPEDVKRGKVISNPGWFGCELANVTTKAAREDKSTNYFFEFKGITGEAKDMTFRRVFNEKGMGFMVPYLVALGCKVDEETGEIQDFDLHTLIGRKVKLYIKQGEYNNQPTNEVAGVEVWPEEAAA